MLLPSRDHTDAGDRGDEGADVERTGDTEGDGDEDDEDFLKDFPDETNVSSSGCSCHPPLFAPRLFIVLRVSM